MRKQICLAVKSYHDHASAGQNCRVPGMTSNGFTLADPNERNMLDVIGFDTSVPAVLSDFINAE